MLSVQRSLARRNSFRASLLGASLTAEQQVPLPAAPAALADSGSGGLAGPLQRLLGQLRGLVSGPGLTLEPSSRAEPSTPEVVSTPVGAGALLGSRQQLRPGPSSEHENGKGWPGSLPGRRPSQVSQQTVVRILEAAAAGGSNVDWQQVDAVLGHQHAATRHFNAALLAAPEPVLQLLLPSLLHTPGAVFKPNAETADILLARLPGSSLRHELDSSMQRLLAAGLPRSYRTFLPWAQAHAQAGSVRGVRHVMEQVERYCGSVSPHYYGLLIRAYCTRGRWKELEPLLQEMRSAGVTPTEHVYRALIWCYGRHHRADRAQAVFDEMQACGVEPGMPTWSCLLNAYAESSQPFRAAEALKSLRALGMTPSVQAFGALAKAFARTGDWRRAYDVIQLMQNDGVEPNEQVYGSIIQAAAVAGKPSVAAEVLRRMQAAGIQPNVIAYTSLLSSFGATGDVAAAQEVLVDMRGSGCRPNAKTYTELMSQLAAKGRYGECEQVFHEMLQDGCPADKVSYAILIDSVLHRWSMGREQRQDLLSLAEQRWQEACRGGEGGAGPLAPHTFLHTAQGRLCLDLHGYSAWTAQLAVLATLDQLLQVHKDRGGRISDVSRLDVITGRGNRSTHRHRSVLRELVLELLQHLLPVSFARANDGLLVLEAKHLRRLFDTMVAEDKSFSLHTMQHCLVEPGACN